jgi:hypothetical protein
MRTLIAITLGLALNSYSVASDDKPTSLTDARAAVEANMRTAEGKAFDELMGAEFPKHADAIRQCKSAAAEDLKNFWILMRLQKDGTVKELLLYPTTKLGTCSGGTLRKQKFLVPPRPDYWVSIYMQLAH